MHVQAFKTISKVKLPFTIKFTILSIKVRNLAKKGEKRIFVSIFKVLSKIEKVEFYLVLITTENDRQIIDSQSTHSHV